ncbi:S8 family serine peptidase [Sphingomonas hankookensis]|uniref:S8 family serine peptidase n=1 Tax=Sphingomonas hankookensis TaxID=563996 RepID=UPI00234E6980|nr:S8 family serine peptidase [Sphingomonas hankookensis]WCP73926.1 S8 family serine peptidase [Sphingomonas hankookensis]
MIAGARFLRCMALALVLPTAASAQLLPVPQLPQLPGRVGEAVDGIRGALPIDAALSDARQLARQSVERARDLARRFPDRIELDRDDNPVRAGEVTLADPDPAVLALVERAGFAVIASERYEDLGIGFARLRAPAGLSAVEAARRLGRIVGGDRVTLDPLYSASGEVAPSAIPDRTPAKAGVQLERLFDRAPTSSNWTPAFAGVREGGGSVPAASKRIGIIDGGVAAGTPGLAAQQGFASGAPRASDHGMAVASLLTGGGGIRASAAGAQLHVADVYGSDPAGGSASALARALAWMVQAKVPVVVMSLAGPDNALLGRFVAAARARGTMVVAAVGNNGPAAPPAYPASYPQAIAVTGVDARGRVLVEAGRARHLDYAAPGADMLALNAAGQARSVRGTSFAAPLVAARLSAAWSGDAAAALKALDREANGGGGRTGRGVLCGGCRTVTR